MLQASDAHELTEKDTASYSLLCRNREKTKTVTVLSDAEAQHPTVFAPLWSVHE